MRRFLETKFVYATGPLYMKWDIIYDKDLKRFIHVIKKESRR